MLWFRSNRIKKVLRWQNSKYYERLKNKSCVANLVNLYDWLVHVSPVKENGIEISKGRQHASVPVSKQKLKSAIYFCHILSDVIEVHSLGDITVGHWTGWKGCQSKTKVPVFYVKEVVEVKDFLGGVEVLISFWLLHLLSSCIFICCLVDLLVILLVCDDNKEDYGWQGQN